MDAERSQMLQLPLLQDVCARRRTRGTERDENEGGEKADASIKDPKLRSEIDEMLKDSDDESDESEAYDLVDGEDEEVYDWTSMNTAAGLQEIEKVRFGTQKRPKQTDNFNPPPTLLFSTLVARYRRKVSPRRSRLR